MNRYAKGANAERELIQQLYSLGFSVARMAGSGKTSLPSPDIIALNKYKKLAFECKAWNGNYLSIPAQQMRELISWGKKAEVEMFVAWKMPNHGWFFLKPEHFNSSEKHFSISKQKALKKAISLNVVLGSQSQLK